MNGADHYAAAEGWLSEVKYDKATLESQQAVQAAQVHATLAVAAATIDAAYGDLSVSADKAWQEVRS
jgi:phage baseplate assembly protein gpV